MKINNETKRFIDSTINFAFSWFFYVFFALCLFAEITERQYDFKLLSLIATIGVVIVVSLTYFVGYVYFIYKNKDKKNGE